MAYLKTILSYCIFVGVAVRGKWRNLRDTFRREFAKTQSSRSGDAGGSSKKVQWAYFELMLFIKDTLSARPSTANIPRDEGNERQDVEDNVDTDEISEEVGNKSQFDRDETTQQDAIENSSGFRTPAREKVVREHRSNLQRKRKESTDVYQQLINIENKKLETYAAKNALSNDSNYHFLMSLLPLMQALQPTRNMQMRLNIQQLFLNDHYQNPPQSTISTPQASPCESYASTSTAQSSTQSRVFSSPADSFTQQTDLSPHNIGSSSSHSNKLWRRLVDESSYGDVPLS